MTSNSSILKNSTQKKVSFGILGFGTHAKRVMIKAFEEAMYAQVRAIATPSSEKKQEITQTYPGITVFNGYEELLSDPQIEAVYIALPNHLHAEWTIRALAHGKHVLCEKPLALTFEEAQEVSSAAKKAQKQVGEAFMYRFHPQHAEVKRLLAQGTLGKLQLLELHYHYLLEDEDNIRAKKDTAGGGLFDVGCYGIDCARFLFEAQPQAVSGSWVIGKSGVDECASFQLFFADGRVANITCGMNLPRENRYTLYGTNGVIEVRDAFHVPRNMQPIVTLKMEGEGGRKIVAPQSNQYVLLIDGFSRGVLGEAVNPILIGNGFENGAIIDRVRYALQHEVLTNIPFVSTGF